jgi:hypothetical protein
MITDPSWAKFQGVVTSARKTHTFDVVAGGVNSICDRTLQLDCGDFQPITMVEITFKSRDEAWACYCKSARITIEFCEESDVERVMCEE